MLSILAMVMQAKQTAARSIQEASVRRRWTSRSGADEPATSVSPITTTRHALLGSPSSSLMIRKAVPGPVTSDGNADKDGTTALSQPEGSQTNRVAASMFPSALGSMPITPTIS